jgi:hypothetical protein
MSFDELTWRPFFVHNLSDAPVWKTLRTVVSNAVKKNSLKPGVDVMIAIFGDFRQFSTKNLAFFSKTGLPVHHTKTG